MSALLDLLTHIGDLKLLPRTGWLFAGIRQPESVADHSYVTIWTALLLAETINEEWQAQGLDAPLQIDRVLQIALVHDLAESVLTDLPKRSTDCLGENVKHAAEAAIVAQLLQAMPNGERYLACWHEYTDGATPEGRLVRDADKLEMISQALRYETMGQRNLADFWQTHQWRYPASADLWHALQQRRAALQLSTSNQPE
jgi:putative hydrolase of HD superfamily